MASNFDHPCSISYLVLPPYPFTIFLASALHCGHILPIFNLVIGRQAYRSFLLNIITIFLQALADVLSSREHVLRIMGTYRLSLCNVTWCQLQCLEKLKELFYGYCNYELCRTLPLFTIISSWRHYTNQ